MTEFDITYHVVIPEEIMDSLLYDSLPGTDYRRPMRERLRTNWREQFFGTEKSESDNLLAYHVRLCDDLVEDSDPTPPIYRVDGEVWVRGMLAARAAGVGFTDGDLSPDPDDWDFDAWDHDVIIQYGLFGEQRYA